MILANACQQYGAFRRTLGERFEVNGRQLKAFCRFMGPDTTIADVSSDKVNVFLAWKSLDTDVCTRDGAESLPPSAPVTQNYLRVTASRRSRRSYWSGSTETRAPHSSQTKAITRSKSLISWMAPHSGHAAWRTPSCRYGFAAAGTQMEMYRRSISAARFRSASGTVAPSARGSPFRSNPTTARIWRSFRANLISVAVMSSTQQLCRITNAPGQSRSYSPRPGTIITSSPLGHIRCPVRPLGHSFS